jgi:hypothetical protein
MDKEKVKAIITKALDKGGKTPGVFDISKALGLRNSLEACKEIGEVINTLNVNQALIQKLFGISENMLDECINELKELKA